MSSYKIKQNYMTNNQTGPEYKPLADLTGFPEGQQEAIEAIIAELRNKKEHPEEFLVRFKPDQTASKLIFELARKDYLKIKDSNMKGGSGDNELMAIYDLVDKKVSFFYYQ